VYLEIECKSIWIKASAKCINVKKKQALKGSYNGTCTFKLIIKGQTQYEAGFAKKLLLKKE